MCTLNIETKSIAMSIAKRCAKHNIYNKIKLTDKGYILYAKCDKEVLDNIITELLNELEDVLNVNR